MPKSLVGYFSDELIRLVHKPHVKLAVHRVPDNVLPFKTMSTKSEPSQSAVIIPFPGSS